MDSIKDSRRSKKEGNKSDYPESVAYIANHVVEGAREAKTVAGLMKSAREILKKAELMPGIQDMIHTVQVEATFPDGTKLVTCIPGSIGGSICNG